MVYFKKQFFFTRFILRIRSYNSKYLGIIVTLVDYLLTIQIFKDNDRELQHYNGLGYELLRIRLSLIILFYF